MTDTCEKHCEATAFKIVIRGLEGEVARLKERLAQPEQEPFGYASEGAAERLTTVKQAHEQIRSFRLFTHDVPLYTNPPAAAQPAPESLNWLTVVYKDIKPGKEAEALILHPQMSAASWSHALNDRDAALTTPPAPQRTWVGLTDEDEIDWQEGGNLKDLVKAIEAKLKEKNT
jgi:hypothetical protein